MKKMNLSLGRIGRMLLPVFLFIGLFLMSANYVSAQTPGDYSTVVLDHMQKLPQVNGVTNPLTKSTQLEFNNPSKLNDYLVALENEFGNLIVYGVTKKGFDNKEAIEKTYELLNVKFSAEYLDPIKQVYIDLLP